LQEVAAEAALTPTTLVAVEVAVVALFNGQLL
jgi:hypothetical protein